MPERTPQETARRVAELLASAISGRILDRHAELMVECFSDPPRRKGTPVGLDEQIPYWIDRDVAYTLASHFTALAVFCTLSDEGGGGDEVPGEIADIHEAVCRQAHILFLSREMPRELWESLPKKMRVEARKLGGGIMKEPG